jgi:hypothetical protein
MVRLLRDTKNVSLMEKAQSRTRWCWIYKIRCRARRTIHCRAFNNAQPIQDVFAQINDRINDEMAAHPEYADDVPAQKSTYPILNYS